MRGTKMLAVVMDTCGISIVATSPGDHYTMAATFHVRGVIPKSMYLRQMSYSAAMHISAEKLGVLWNARLKPGPLCDLPAPTGPRHAARRPACCCDLTDCLPPRRAERRVALGEIDMRIWLVEILVRLGVAVIADGRFRPRWYRSDQRKVCKEMREWFWCRIGSGRITPTRYYWARWVVTGSNWQKQQYRKAAALAADRWVLKFHQLFEVNMLGRGAKC